VKSGRALGAEPGALDIDRGADREPSLGQEPPLGYRTPDLGITSAIGRAVRCATRRGLTKAATRRFSMIPILQRPVRTRWRSRLRSPGRKLCGEAGGENK